MNLSLLLEPQRDHAMRLLNSIYMNGIAADLSETGTGKTYVASWLAKTLNCPVVVVCPKVVIPTWKKVLKVFDITNCLVINYEKLIRGNTEYLKFKNGRDDSPYYYDVRFSKDSLVIFDESHRCKAWNSKNSDFLIAVKKNNYKMLLLSATQATNPLEMKAFGFATTLHNLVNYKQFLSGTGVFANRFGGLSINVEDPRTATAMKHIHKDLFENYKVASRMTVSQFGSIFPDNRVIADVFDMGANTKKIQDAYDIMAEALAKLEQSSANYSQHHFAIMIKTRMLVETLKIPTIVEMVEDLYDEGLSPVIFVNFNQSVEALVQLLSKSKKYGNKIGFIVGGQSDKNRQRDIDLFQQDQHRIMIANTQAGGVGVSLHDLHGKFPRRSLIFPTWSAVNMLQSLGRIHRAEAKTTCIQKIVYASNTIEERVCQRVQCKLTNLSSLNDGDLAVEYKYV